ncbi:MAG: AtpZ/AtpI family protein [Acidobacteria bacterium]|nr:AtpZ/AtpI family protein [Acidobacteriota bacterium]
MIKSLFEDEPSELSEPQPAAERPVADRANVLGIFGNEEEEKTPHRTASGPFDISGLDLPFPITDNKADEPSATNEQPEPPQFLTLSTPEQPEETPIQPEIIAPKADYSPPTTEESVRMTGLAFSAGIVLAGPIVFMMVIGWFADLLIGSSPWGLVGGVVLGSIVGFVQIFRLNTQILGTSKRDTTAGLLDLSSHQNTEEKPSAEAPENTSSPENGKSLGLH